MCGRYVLKREDLEALVKQFGIRSLEEFHSRYNIAPTSVVPVIRNKRGDIAQGPEVVGLRWGLIPGWSRADTPLRPLVNVRSETALLRFRGSLKSRRCILPASGFYEWETRDGRKQPWLFSLRQGGPIGLAGIWDVWRGPEGTEQETCAILTTAPNSILGRIHDRMPVMLAPEQCEAWMAPRLSDPASVESLMTPAPEDSIVAVKVGPTVSNVRNDTPECIAAAPDEPGDATAQLSLGL